MTTVAHPPADIFPFLAHHPFGRRRQTRPRSAVRKIVDRLTTDTTLRPIMLTLTTSIRATARQIRALGRRFVAACPELPLVELRHEPSPIGRQHLHALVLAPESVTEADLVSRWTGMCPETSEAAQHAVTVEADTSALGRVWSYIAKKGSALVARIRRAVASVTPSRVCSECGCSLDHHRPHAVTCGPTCRQRRSRRLRRKRDSAVAPSRAHTSLRAGARLDDPHPTHQHDTEPSEPSDTTHAQHPRTAKVRSESANRRPAPRVRRPTIESSPMHHPRSTPKHVEVSYRRPPAGLTRRESVLDLLQSAARETDPTVAAGLLQAARGAIQDLPIAQRAGLLKALSKVEAMQNARGEGRAVHRPLTKVTQK